ncbi:MAG TPA: glucose-1-phosphate adenylyltransferase [Polyangia bacterium]
MDSQLRVLALVMAGGRGSRLFPLTRDRAKPAVPFGGRYRIIDFVLSNLVNSGVRAIYVLTQYKAQSLVEHIQRTWGMRSSYSDFVTVVPAQMRIGETWYRGTADSVYQNYHMVEDYRPDAVLVFGADHVYKMNVAQMVSFHAQRNAVATVACIPIPVHEASSFGIVETDTEGRSIGFQEKPTENPTTIPGDPTRCLASMGNYIFAPGPLREALLADANAESHHDFGRNILPELVKSGRVFAYDFSQNRIPGVTDAGELGYWRDVGTIEAYYEATLDLKNVVPHLNLYNWEWPILSANYPDPPSKLVFDDPHRQGVLLQSVVSGGCIIAGGFVKDCVLGRNVVIGEGAEVRDSILFDNVTVGKRARIQRAIIDKNVRVADGDHIGHDLARDAIRHHVSDEGITVVGKARDTLLTRSRDFT